MKRPVILLLLSAMVSLLCGTAYPQNVSNGMIIAGLFDSIKDALLEKAPNASIGSLIDDRSLSTSLSDAYPEFPLVKETYVVKNEEPKPIESLPVDENGYRILKPGYYYKEVSTY